MKKKTIKDEEGYLGMCVRPSQSILSFFFSRFLEDGVGGGVCVMKSNM